MAKNLSCGVELMRGILLFLNILFIIIGLALVGVGIYIKVDTNFASILNDIANNSKFDAQSLGFLAYMMIGGGVITLLIALFGCAGALWHSRCLLYMYAFILTALMIAEFVAIIMAIVYKGKLQQVYDDTLLDIFKTGFLKNDTEFITAFHSLEEAITCCGVKNVSDYEEFLYRVTETCKSNPNRPGCGDKIIEILDTNLPIIGGVLGGVLVLELITLISAIALAIALKHAPDESYSSNPRDIYKNIRDN